MGRDLSRAWEGADLDEMSVPETGSRALGDESHLGRLRRGVRRTTRSWSGRSRRPRRDVPRVGHELDDLGPLIREVAID